MNTIAVLGSLRDLHEGFAWVMVIGNGLAGAWALSAHRVEALRGRSLWWFTALVQVAIAVQVTMGVGLVAGQDDRPAAVPPLLRVRGPHRRGHRLQLPPKHAAAPAPALRVCRPVSYGAGHPSHAGYRLTAEGTGR